MKRYPSDVAFSPAVKEMQAARGSRFTKHWLVLSVLFVLMYADELCTLHEMSDRPLRRLFKAAGPALQAIKPVCMMSPLSVAQYLEPGAMSFDLLLVDEASQVEPVDALGAVARARQIVVVGDDKQLPPTRFFLRMTSEEPAENEEEEIAQAADVESILGLCAARGLPQAMLRWHYRSRHHSLIAVSNRRFYDDDSASRILASKAAPPAPAPALVAEITKLTASADQAVAQEQAAKPPAATQPATEAKTYPMPDPEPGQEPPNN